jgi:aminoglycoside phosphotransferase (APT) family kinase protein
MTYLTPHSTTMLDQPSTIRDGEELDVERLSAYCAANIPDFTGELTVQQFPSGFSNLTYMLEATVGDVRKQFVLRRPPFGANIKSAHDMEREFKVLRALRTAQMQVPEALVYCKEQDVLGAPFYVMERVEGVILRAKQPEGGVDLSAPVMARLSTLLVDNLAALHNTDITSSPDLQTLGKPDGYTRRQVEGWIQRYERARTDTIVGMERAAKWLAANIPDGKTDGMTNAKTDGSANAGRNAATLIHNDYKYDNIVFSPDMASIRAVLDWEMATIGDPLMDLGTTLGYWAEENDPEPLKMFGLTRLPGNLNREDVVARYAAQTGRDVSNIVFYYVFGLYKIGVIAQQIYSRFKQGYTHDPRFASLIFVIQSAGTMAQQALERGKLRGL